MLDKAARTADWETVVCPGSEAGWLALKRQRFQLALVDMDGVQAADDLRRLCEDIAQSKKTLLMLCGNEGNALEEIWARQLGAWLYLPGVTQGNDLVALCAEARPVAEKLLGPIEPLRHKSANKRYVR